VENDVLGLNRRLPDNFQQAVDAISDPVTNQPRCRDTSPGVLGRTCIPFNPFGQQNTPEALAYSFTSTREKQKLRQSNAGFTFVSDSSNMFELPAGPVDFAGGIEWRKERSATEGDPVVIADLTESAAQPNEKGGFEVGEAFVEFSLPLVRNVFLVNDLTADVAYRAADYTHSGRANASKYALSWSIVPQFTLRGTAGKAVRAPAITEAFRPTTPGFSSVTDPCDTDNVNNDPDRAANCAALGLPGGFEAMDNVSVISESSGNPDLSPEESTSFTYGFIFQPDWFAPGLSLTADLYDIEIEDAITLVTAQNIVNNCVDATGGPDFSFCDQFTRDGSQNIDFVRSTFINASKFETEGIDMQVNYEKSLDEFGINWLEGVLNFSFTGNYLRELNVFEFQNRPDEIDIERGEIGDPIRAYRSSLSYQIADIALGWEVRYLGNQRRFNIGVDNSEDMSPSDTGTSTYHDVNFRWFLPTGNIRLELYGGINNATDEEPPIGIVGVEGNEAIYDAIGRFYFLGIRGNL
jgi:outer membrane receptor protein involved in Fe transport